MVCLLLVNIVIYPHPYNDYKQHYKYTLQVDTFSPANLKYLYSMKINILKQIVFVVSLVLFSKVSLADTIAIDKSSYSVWFVSSFLNSKPAENAFDNDMVTYWALNNVGYTKFPQEIVVDLGEEKSVNGFSYLPNGKSGATRRSKTTYFEVFVTNDTLDFGTPQLKSMMIYESTEDTDRKDFYFGAKSGRYVKVVYLNNYHGFLDPLSTNRNIHTNDLYFFENTDGTTAKSNQLITFETIEPIGTSSAPFDIAASSESGEVISYEIVSGPATVSGSTITPTGGEGIVVVKATVPGNAEYYEGQGAISFHVINTALFKPAIRTSLTKNFPLYMSELKPYPISFFVDSLPAYIQVDSIAFTVDGNYVDYTYVNGGYFVNWLPKSYGFHVVKIYTMAANGNSDEETLLITVKQQSTNMTVTLLNNALINSNTSPLETKHELPQFVGVYDQIIGHLTLSYPDGGGDIWDRVSRIWIRSNNSPWIEIIRYVTPYNKVCDHTIDLTDYASILQGNVELMTWAEANSKGFIYNLDLEYIAGEPDYLYSQVTQLWNGRYNFGNYDNLQPVPKKTVILDTNVLETKLNLVTTGHGWSDINNDKINTGNAAEFFEATHKIIVNEQTTFDQYLWANCNPNPDGCSPQNGTWQYSRAGWCPGAIATLYDYDLNDEFISDDQLVDTMKLQYVFQEDYVDMCHPNYPDCVSGENACPDCFAGMNPNYIVSGNLISYIKAPKASTETTVFIPERPIVKLGFKPYPTVSCGEVFVDAEFDAERIVVEIIGVSGVAYKNYFFQDSYELNGYMFELSDLNSGIYIMRITTTKGYGAQKIIIE